MHIKINKTQAGWWLHTPLIPALGKQKQADLSDLEASLAYIASLRSAKAT